MTKRQDIRATGRVKKISTSLTENCLIDDSLRPPKRVKSIFFFNNTIPIYIGTFDREKLLKKRGNQLLHLDFNRLVNNTRYARARRKFNKINSHLSPIDQ